MTDRIYEPGQNKISPAFAARLARLEPDETIRAIVLLYPKDGGGSGGHRQNPAARQEGTKAMVESAKEALVDIDDILDRYAGHRLAETPDALGSLAVESTAAGIRSLTTSKWVKAIFEDQPIHLLF